MTLLSKRGHTPSRLLVKKSRRLVSQRRKVTVFVAKVSGKISFLTIPSHSQLILQPRRRIARSHSILLFCSFGLLVSVSFNIPSVFDAKNSKKNITHRRFFFVYSHGWHSASSFTILFEIKILMSHAVEIRGI